MRHRVPVPRKDHAMKRSLEPIMNSLGGLGEFGEEVESENGSDVFEVVLLSSVEEVVIIGLDVHGQRNFFVIVGSVGRLTVLGSFPHFA